MLIGFLPLSPRPRLPLSKERLGVFGPSSRGHDTGHQLVVWTSLIRSCSKKDHEYSSSKAACADESLQDLLLSYRFVTAAGACGRKVHVRRDAPAAAGRGRAAMSRVPRQRGLAICSTDSAWERLARAIDAPLTQWDCPTVVGHSSCALRRPRSQRSSTSYGIRSDGAVGPL